jgi:hypothetical protein
MLTLAELKSLQDRKQVLLARSDVYRVRLQCECQQIRRSTAWITRTASFFHSWSPFLFAAAPILGFLLVKKKGSNRPLGKFYLGWQLWRKVWPFMRLLRSSNNAPAPASVSSHS